MKEKNGFTLIELLAVIIILGILMIIAIPAVTKYINNSKKSGYVSTAKSIVGGARNLIHSGSLDLSDESITYYIEGKCIETDKEYVSPYGEFRKAYVVVVLEGDHYEYYWVSVDDTQTGVATLKNIDKLDNEDIIGDIDINSIKPIIGIDKRKMIVTVEGDSCTKSAPVEATQMMNGKTGKIKEACGPVTETIYWGLSEPDDDDTYHKLIISDSPVSGGETGSFPGNSVFSDDNRPGWANYWLARIDEIEIVGRVAPTSISYWFADLGAYSTNINFDLNDLEVCNVTDMSYAFYSTGQYSNTFRLSVGDWETSSAENMYCMFCSAGQDATTWNINGINNWDTSSVKNMGFMFNYAGYVGQSNISMDLSDWDTSSVTDMKFMFYYAFHNASSIDLNLSGWILPQDLSQMLNNLGYRASSFSLNVSNWDTSKTKIMSNLFCEVGHDATTWSIQGLDTWNVSNLENTSYMFYRAGNNASSFNMNLSSWQTKNLKNMSTMFYYAGENSPSFNLNLSGWDVSNVYNFYSFIYGAGGYSSTYNLNVSNWKLGNITSLDDIFSNAGYNATNVDINASNWDTSKIKSMSSTYYYAGYNSSTFKLNLTGWNTSNVTNMSYMFYGTCENAQNVTVIIPSTNGNGINNTTSIIYGNSQSINASLPSGKAFTLVD